MDAYKDATGFPPISIGGTHEIRMAIRLDAGRTLDECVAKEIIYRVGLAWQSPVLWPPPAGWVAGTEAGEGM